MNNEQWNEQHYYSILYPSMVAVGQITTELIGQLVLVDEVVQLDDVCQYDHSELEVLAEQFVRHFGYGFLQEAHRS